MNPGVGEEVGKTARTFMDIMKEQPLALAMAIMNIALLGFFWLIMEKVSANRERETRLMYDEQKEVRELLARCIVPEKKP